MSTNARSPTFSESIAASQRMFIMPLPNKPCSTVHRSQSGLGTGGAWQDTIVELRKAGKTVSLILNPLSSAAWTSGSTIVPCLVSSPPPESVLNRPLSWA